METNRIYNEDCFETMKKMNKEVDVILTSPPYNTTSRAGAKKDKYISRYDTYKDFKDDNEYINWTIEIFKAYNIILKNNGVILYNLSYSSEKPRLMWDVINNIINKTNFTIADCIIWKKKNALPNNTSPNKLTRIVEYIYVFCRENELKTFITNKQVTKISNGTERKGQKYYENIFNFIEAPNNDKSCQLNKATYSTELCENLLKIYAPKNTTVYDSFIGTGTTAVACKNLNLKYIGSEISEEQCKYARDRLYNTN